MTDMRRHVRSQTAALLGRLALQVDRAAAGDADSIHDLRVAIRRLSRCLRVFSAFYPGRSWKTLRKQMRVLMGAAGVARDYDIAIELLGEAGLAPGSAILKRLAMERLQAREALALEIHRWQAGDLPRQWPGRLEL
jgi:CHAD domain-containing protein